MHLSQRTLGLAVVLLSVAGEPVEAQQRLDALLADTARTRLFAWCYPGGEMEPAEMRFWSNGLVELEAQAISADRETRYLAWSYATADSAEIRLWMIDPRIDFESLLSVEQAHPHMASYDAPARSITYRTITPTHDAIFFGNWRFDRQYCSE